MKADMKAYLRKRKILDCSKKEFSKNGFYKTQIGDIANSANVSRATIYQYFNNKDEIYMTLLDEHLYEWKKIISKNDIDISSFSPPQYFSYKVRRTLKFFAGDRYLSNIILRVGLGVPKDLSKPVKQFEETVIESIVTELSKGINNNNIRDDIELEFTANLISGAILRTASYYFGPNKRKKPLNIKKAADEITDLFIPGLFTEEGLSADKKISA
jgi:AcrR family transcriptional regulator